MEALLTHPELSANDPADLLAEVEQLRSLVAKQQQQITGLEKEQALWQAHEQDYQALLETKSEVIRKLTAQVGAMEEDLELATRPASPEAEVIALRRELEQEREKIKEAEQALAKQTRELEVQMSRERAEVGRQRHELQRAQEEIQQQLDAASRDGNAHEKLAPLYRLQSELAGRNVPAAPSAPASETAPNSDQAPTVRGSGLFRRLFGTRQSA